MPRYEPGTPLTNEQIKKIKDELGRRFAEEVKNRSTFIPPKIDYSPFILDRAGRVRIFNVQTNLLQQLVKEWNAKIQAAKIEGQRERHTSEEALKGFQMPLNQNDQVPFGKYKGMRWADVPEEYFEFLISQQQKNIDEYRQVVEQRRQAAEASEGMIGKIIHAGFRTLAMQLHPDKGGDPRQFQDLKASYEQLKEIIREVQDARRDQQKNGAAAGGEDPFTNPATR